jgi:uncharacterized protein DUF6551
MNATQVAPEKRVSHRIVERHVGELMVDPNVQRGVRKHRVTEMAKAFDPDALGVLTTSLRASGVIHIVDGQHRYRVCETANYEGVIQTMEYQGLTLSEEAALFRKLNNTQVPSAIDRFIVACVEEDPDTLRLAEYLSSNGWSVAAYAGNGRLSAIGALWRVYKLSPDAAAGTLAVLTKAYGHRPQAVQGALLEGLGVMLARYGRDVNLTDLADAMSKVPGGPDGLVGNARGQKMSKTGNLSTMVAKIITNDIYNKRRRSTALPAWS